MHAVVADLVGGLSVLCIAAIGRWVWRIVKAVEKVEKQVTPNGGTSGQIGDRVMRLERQQKEMKWMLRRLMKALGYTPDRTPE